MKKRKKNAKLDKTTKRMRELHNILDKNYFHVYTSINRKYVGEIQWKVYYSNLPTQLYYSNKNKELLSSDRNSIEDIYKLKNKFEKEKKKIINENTHEYVRVSNEVFCGMYEAKKKFVDFTTISMLLLLLANIVNLFTFENLAFSIFSLIYSVTQGILSTYKLQQIDKIKERTIHRMHENYTREKIRRQGLYFVKRLKDDV